jgi:hypothetical protein
MKRNENTPGGCARKFFVPERSVEGERSSKKHGIRRNISREETKISMSRGKDHEVRPPV